MSATVEEQIAELTRQRDLALEVAAEAMRLLPDKDLATLRLRLEGVPDNDGHDKGDGSGEARPDAHRR
jgi:hypothetical protein